MEEGKDGGEDGERRGAGGREGVADHPADTDETRLLRFGRVLKDEVRELVGKYPAGGCIHLIAELSEEGGGS